jgi:hypothetical protein
LLLLLQDGPHYIHHKKWQVQKRHNDERYLRPLSKANVTLLTCCLLLLLQDGLHYIHNKGWQV